MQRQHSIKYYKEIKRTKRLKRKLTAKRNKEILDKLRIKYTQSLCGNMLSINDTHSRIYFTLSTGNIHICNTKEHKRGIRTLLSILGYSDKYINAVLKGKHNT